MTNKFSAKRMLRTSSWGVQKRSLLCGSVRNWADLDRNLLEEILSRVPIHDLFNASLVCQSWKDTSCNILFWKHNVLDLSATGADFHPNSSTIELLRLAESGRLYALFGEPQSEEQCSRIANNLSRLLQLALEGETLQGWRGSVKTIILPYDLEISDEHLLYIVERTPCVRHLMLLNTHRITLAGFSKATRHWSHLKEIHLGSMDCRKWAYFLLVLGMNSQQLEFLHLHQRGMFIQEPDANWIVRNPPRVKKVEFDSCWIFPCALKGFFLHGINVEELYFTRCGLASYANKDYFRPSYGLYDTARLVENFTLSWSMCSGGYPRWHPKFLSDDASATKVKLWLCREVRCPSRQAVSS